MPGGGVDSSAGAMLSGTDGAASYMLDVGAVGVGGLGGKLPT